MDYQVLVRDSVLNRVDSLFVIDFEQAIVNAPGRFSIVPWVQDSVPNGERATVEGGLHEGFVLAFWDAFRTPTRTILVGGVPGNTDLPVISGSAQVGQTLMATAGTWTNSPSSYAYQWYDSASGLIAGATASVYVPNVGDVGNTMTVSVVATNASGSSAPATSAPTFAVTAGGGGILDFSLALNSALIGAVGA